MPHAPLTNPVTAQHAAQIAGLTTATKSGWRDRTIQVIGDVHVGWTPQQRLDDAQADLIASDGLAAVRVFIGDVTDTVASSSEDTAALAFLNASSPSGWKAVIGNHDRQQNSTPTWETVYGHSRNWYQDIGTDVRVIGVSPDTGGTDPITLTTATLNWLDARLAETTRQCLICCHAPLQNTVMGGFYNSESTFFSAQPNASIRGILKARSNARAWISGHTHTPLESTTLIKNEPLGDGHFIAAINVGAPAYTGYTVAQGKSTSGTPNPPSGALDHPNFSAFVTCYPDTVEVRYRDHLTGEWLAWQSALVTSEPRATAAVESAALWSFAQPLLFLSPSSSRDAAGTVTPVLLNAPPVVAGTYGTAWDCAAGGVRLTLSTENTRIRADRGTALVRAAVRAGTARRVLLDIGNTISPTNALMQLRYDAAAPYDQLKYVHFIGTTDDADVAMTSPYGDDHATVLAYMIRWDGPHLSVAIGNSQNAAAADRTQIAPFASSHFISVGLDRSAANFSNALIESVMVFDRAITDYEFDLLAAKTTAWTWGAL